MVVVSVGEVQSPAALFTYLESIHLAPFVFYVGGVVTITVICICPSDAF